MLLKRGSKSEAVRVMQQLLVSCGYTLSVDGIYGSGTERVVRLFQEDALFPPKEQDGICGNNTYKALIEASKRATQNYKESIVWLNPKDLKCALVNGTSSSLLSKFKSFMNGTFYWYNSTDKKYYTIGWLYSEGKRIQDNNITCPRGTLLVLKSGDVICRRMTNAELLEYKKNDNIWFCIQGFETFDAKNMKVENWDIGEIGRKCIRNVIGYNAKTGKILIAFFSGSWETAIQIAKKYELSGAICLDAGGSSNFVLNGKKIYSTSRVQSNVVFW